MNSALLAEKIASEHDLPRSKAKLLVATLLDAIAEAASRGEEVSLPGFGKFKVVARAAREGDRAPSRGVEPALLSRVGCSVMLPGVAG